MIQQQNRGSYALRREGEKRDSTTWTCSSACFKFTVSCLVKRTFSHTDAVSRSRRREEELFESKEREKDSSAFGGPSQGSSGEMGVCMQSWDGMQQLARQDSLCRLSPFFISPTPATSIVISHGPVRCCSANQMPLEYKRVRRGHISIWAAHSAACFCFLSLTEPALGE